MFSILFASVWVFYVLYAGTIMAAFWMHKGGLAYEKGDYGDAEIYYRKVNRNTDISIAAIYNLGNALYQQGRYLEAIRFYKQKLQDGDGGMDAACWNNLGTAYFKVGDLEKSAAAFKGSLLIWPDDIDVRKNFRFVMILLRKRKKPGHDSKDKRAAEKKGNKEQEERSENTGNAADEKISGKDMESLLDMVRRNEEMKKGQLSKIKKKLNQLNPDEKDY